MNITFIKGRVLFLFFASLIKLFDTVSATVMLFKHL